MYLINIQANIDIVHVVGVLELKPKLSNKFHMPRFSFHYAIFMELR